MTLRTVRMIDNVPMMDEWTRVWHSYMFCHKWPSSAYCFTRADAFVWCLKRKLTINGGQDSAATTAVYCTAWIWHFESELRFSLKNIRALLGQRNLPLESAVVESASSASLIAEMDSLQFVRVIWIKMKSIVCWKSILRSLTCLLNSLSEVRVLTQPDDNAMHYLHVSRLKLLITKTSFAQQLLLTRNI